MAASGNYWTDVATRRIRRRRFLRGFATLGASAAAANLLGCGVLGGDDESGVAGDKSGLLAKPEDTTSRAVPGGILPGYAISDTPTFDGFTGPPVAKSLNSWAYARLVDFHMYNKAAGEKPANSVDPYGAASWEVTPDGRQYTFKLRPEGRLDPRTPTSGRVLNAEDVVFSWNRFKTVHSGRGTLAYEVNPAAPIESVSAPDSTTVVFKLAFPTVSILQSLGFWPLLYLMPKEADGGFDPRQTMRGSGPWMLSEYEPSIGFKFRRNPNFYRKDRPYVDGVDWPIVREYAQTLAQLKAGNIYAAFVQPTDILQTKADVPSLRMLQLESYPTSIATHAFFNFKLSAALRDERVRQAMSMLIDRALFLEVRSNLAAFEKAGLPLATRWSTILPPGEEEFWLDPQSKEFGPNAKYFAYDPAEAKKLIQATGQGVIEQPVTSVQGSEYGQDYLEDVQVLKGMWQANGDFKFQENLVDALNVFQPRYGLAGPRRDWEGNGGVALGTSADIPEVDILFGSFYMRGSTFDRLDGNYLNDTKWDELMQAQRVEFDQARRVSLLHDIQRYAAQKMYTINRPGYALGFSLTQPWVNNVGVFAYRTPFYGTSQIMEYWLDASRR